MSQLTEHISRAEYACRHCGSLPSNFHNEPLYGYLFDIFERIRLNYGKAIPVNSGYRCLEYQEQLLKQGKTNSLISAHIFGLALDLGASSAAETERLFRTVILVDPKLRIGYERYRKAGQHFIHIDIAYFITPRPISEFVMGARW